MSANDFRIGQLVSAADSAKLAALCATYTHYSIHGIIVEVDEHRVDVKWIDYTSALNAKHICSILRCCAPARSPQVLAHAYSPADAPPPHNKRAVHTLCRRMPSPALRSAN